MPTKVHLVKAMVFVLKEYSEVQKLHKDEIEKIEPGARKWSSPVYATPAHCPRCSSSDMLNVLLVFFLALAVSSV